MIDDPKRYVARKAGLFPHMLDRGGADGERRGSGGTAAVRSGAGSSDSSRGIGFGGGAARAAPADGGRD